MTLLLTSAVVAIDLAHAMVWSECGHRYHLAEPREEDRWMRMLLEKRVKEALGTNSFDASAEIWSAFSLRMWPEHGAALLPPRL